MIYTVYSTSIKDKCISSLHRSSDIQLSAVSYNHFGLEHACPLAFSLNFVDHTTLPNTTCSPSNFFGNLCKKEEKKRKKGVISQRTMYLKKGGKKNLCRNIQKILPVFFHSGGEELGAVWIFPAIGHGKNTCNTTRLIGPCVSTSPSSMEVFLIAFLDREDHSALLWLKAKICNTCSFRNLLPKKKPKTIWPMTTKDHPNAN